MREPCYYFGSILWSTGLSISAGREFRCSCRVCVSLLCCLAGTKYISPFGRPLKKRNSIYSDLFNICKIWLTSTTIVVTSNSSTLDYCTDKVQKRVLQVYWLGYTDWLTAKSLPYFWSVIPGTWYLLDIESATSWYQHLSSSSWKRDLAKKRSSCEIFWFTINWVVFLEEYYDTPLWKGRFFDQSETRTSTTNRNIQKPGQKGFLAFWWGIKRWCSYIFNVCGTICIGVWSVSQQLPPSSSGRFQLRGQWCAIALILFTKTTRSSFLKIRSLRAFTIFQTQLLLKPFPTQHDFSYFIRRSHNLGPLVDDRWDTSACLARIQRPAKWYLRHYGRRTQCTPSLKIRLKRPNDTGSSTPQPKCGRFRSRRIQKGNDKSGLWEKSQAFLLLTRTLPIHCNSVVVHDCQYLAQFLSKTTDLEQ